MAKIRNVARYAKKVVKRELAFRSGKLTSVAFDLTYRCNLKCEMCSLWRIPPGEIDELEHSDWLRVVDQLAEMGVEQITLNGGEPTIVHGFWDLVKHIKDSGISVGVFTNALSLPKYVEQFGELVDSINLSVDAPDERHDKIRGLPGALDLTLKGAREILQYREQHNQKSPVINMHTTLSKSNIDGIGDIIRLADDLGVDVASFQYISCSSQAQVDNSVIDGQVAASDRFTCADQSSLLLDDEGVVEFRKQVNSLPSTKRTLVMMEPTRHLSDKALKTGKFPTKRCTPMMNRLLVHPNGDTSVCAHLTRYSLGSVRQMSVREIWEGEARRKLVSALSRRLMPVCQNCCAFSTTLTVGQMAQIALGRCI